MQYWLMKSEPDTFSIDDLEKSPQKITAWEGVRNYQARNFMRAMQKGDLAFFYHSSCKVPAIVGVMKVVQEAYPDKSAQNPQSPYFDEKSTSDNPRWFNVDVQWVKTFKNPITLAEIRHDRRLTTMRLVKPGNRLSITPVAPKEWEVIMKSLCD